VAITRQLQHACLAAGKPLDEDEAAHKPASSDAKQQASGTVEDALMHLHAAELMLVELLPLSEMEARIPYVIARLQTCMDPHARLPHIIAAQLDNHSGDKDIQCFRAVFSNATRAAYAASDEQHALLRQFRNILWVGFIVMTILAVSVAYLSYRYPDAIELCFNPTGGQVCPTGPDPSRIDLPLIAILGTIGGALSAAIALRNMRGTPAPYSISLALSLFKFPMGALTAIAGLLLVHGKFVPGLSDLDSSGQILAYALAFGVAQQVATQFVDRRAREVLSTVPGREPISAPGHDAYQGSISIYDIQPVSAVGGRNGHETSDESAGDAASNQPNGSSRQST
jgi:hypothetical protein